MPFYEQNMYLRNRQAPQDNAHIHHYYHTLQYEVFLYNYE